MNTIKYDPLGEKTLDFAIKIVKLGQCLNSEKKEFLLSKQIVRSGTNPGAMVREAANAESGLDFIHKLGIAQKEIGETEYWLEILFRTELISKPEYIDLKSESSQIMKLIRSSILTRKKNLAKKIVPIIISFLGLYYFKLFIIHRLSFIIYHSSFIIN